ncbi:glycosyl transferase [Neptunitalea chrysea]|uniref:Glycosyl transferase n=1 Tax=Neptunitalea chrysea TaxID=1647581 RepID=A0A9W6B713_9FLAO|nr:glycosyltransferase family 2 protein [Neptunitalea chrysea]GLB53740.1 glycosyl transferase [Neptunitalea chrysea]
MQQQPLFSIIIPLYNKEKYILKTLQSVLQQDYTNFEIVLVNDCCTDNSLQQVATVNDDRIVLIHHPHNKGLAASRNTGITNAKGAIICLLDADDLYEPNFLSTIYNLQASFPEADFYGTDYYEQYSFGKLRTNKTVDTTKENTSFLVEDFFKYNLGQPIICQSSLTFKKSVLDTTEDLFDTNINYAEDVDFYIKAFSTYKLAYCFKPLATYRNDIPNQMVYSKISGKNYPDFSSYDKYSKDNTSLQKYLDFQRYSFASNLRLEGNKHEANKLIAQINFSNINSKQRLLVRSPLFVVKMIKATKRFLMKQNIKVSTY